MQRLLTGLSTCIFLFLCAGAAHANILLYQATLNGLNENPSNGSPGTGNAFVYIDDVAHTMTLNVTFAGLAGPTTVAHIHCCIAAPGNTSVATTTPTFPGFPPNVTAGTFSATFSLLSSSTYRAGFITANGGSVAGAEAALMAGLASGQSYLNIHTQAFPGGEIRGFLTAAVPEPASIALLGLGAAGLLLARRRRV